MRRRSCPAPRPLARRSRPLPAKSAGLSREKTQIVEAQLIGREFGFWFARIDWWRGVDFRDRFSHEQALANKLSEAQVQHFQGIQAARETQEQIGDYRRDDLQTNGVVVPAHELAKIEMLFDPTEQKFDLPATFVERGNLDCRAFEIVGDESDFPAFVAFDLDASQRDRQLGIALAGEHHVGIGDDSEAVAYVLRTYRDFVLRKRVFTLTRVTKKALAALIFFHQPK